MRTLLDTNILLRSSQPASPHHAHALAAVSTLLKARRIICLSSQTIYEFLAVATRPIAENGLGMQHAHADAQLTKLLAGIEVFYDSEPVATKVRQLVVDYQVTGKKTHDARLAAVMNVHGVPEILTFNGIDFNRFPGINVLSPAHVALDQLPSYPPASA